MAQVGVTSSFLGPLNGRARQMAASVGAAARGTGMPADEVEVVLTAYALGMSARVSLLDDDHHPAYLHPGRSILTLLQDVGRVEVQALVLAAVHDSMDDGLRADPGEIADRLGVAVAEGLRTIPLPGSDEFLEKLVGLPRAVGLAALAERLDQLRHLHLRPDQEPGWRSARDEVRHAWLPYAERMDARLATRYAHWARLCERRIGRGSS